MAINLTGESFLSINEPHFEPVEYQKVAYGKSIIFNNKKQAIKFSSKFDDIAFLKYKDIEKIEIIYVNKKKYWLPAALLAITIVGIIAPFAVAHLPNWRVLIQLKEKNSTQHKKQYISIRTHLNPSLAIFLKKFLLKNFKVESKPEVLSTLHTSTVQKVIESRNLKLEEQEEKDEN